MALVPEKKGLLKHGDPVPEFFVRWGGRAFRSSRQGGGKARKQAGQGKGTA